jgi:hypothetical protein
MPQMIKSYAVNKESLATLLANGFWKGANLEIGLLKAGGSYDFNMDLTYVKGFEPSNVEFPGYAAVTPITWAAEYRGSAGASLTDTGLIGWTATADLPAPLDIVGQYIDNATDVVVYLLDAPVRVQYKDDRVALIFPFGYA